MVVGSINQPLLGLNLNGMTPKEKAKELVDKYDETLTYLESKSKAKECAMIAVKEILRVAFYADDWLYNHFLEVKQEIDKL